jgi:mannitol/fructose-specific phosphotransferase system IIA component (Ntr-type)
MMPLSDIFGRECIKLDLESETKDQVFEELIDVIAGSRPDYERRQMLDAVILRENLMNTAILPGVAVPHGYYSAVRGVVGALGFSRAGIEYGSHEPVHAVFMLFMDKLSQERHLGVLSRLLELLNSKSFPAIQAAENPREVYDILCRF